jgi:hypothetical protein
LLIETHGADVNIQDNKKDTPLHIAFPSFDPNDDDNLTPILVYLFSKTNIDVNIQDKNGHTILHLACIYEIASPDYGDDDYDDEDEDDHDEDDDDDSDAGLEDSVIQNQKADANLSRIVEVIAERCVQQVLDETNLE